jgi:hypothetical protein
MNCANGLEEIITAGAAIIAVPPSSINERSALVESTHQTT